jgi:hypothetical protein
MARLLNCGFELNKLADSMEVREMVDGGGNYYHYLSSTTIYSGTYAGRLLTAVAGTYPQYKQVICTDDSADFLVARMRFNFHAFGNTITDFLTFCDNSYSGRIKMQVNTNGSVVLVDEDGTVGTSAAGTIVVDTWYRAELKLDKTGAGGAHICQLKLDGNILLGSTTRNISRNISFVYCGFGPGAFTAGEVFMDDYSINDDAGTFQNDYLGDGKLIYLFPDSAGDNADWTRSTGANNWANVDDPPASGGPNDATDYNYSNTVNQIDDFNIGTTIPSSPSVSDTINMVAVNVRYTCDNSGAPASFVVRCKASASGTVEESSAITPNTTAWRLNSNDANFLFAPLTLYDLPGASTTVWTATELETAQIGYRISTGNTNNVRISTIWMVVDYTYVAPVPRNIDLTLDSYLNVGPQIVG